MNFKPCHAKWNLVLVWRASQRDDGMPCDAHSTVLRLSRAIVLTSNLIEIIVGPHSVPPPSPTLSCNAFLRFNIQPKVVTVNGSTRLYAIFSAAASLHPAAAAVSPFTNLKIKLKNYRISVRVANHSGTFISLTKDGLEWRDFFFVAFSVTHICLSSIPRPSYKITTTMR